ncbi:lytic transglycosylase domain-containing protein [Sulfobacillus sp. DSM 109850]|uniref:Lytic transglycosylase domain-containing protein n=2 Tax=Sulfobacillus harzensis TaxID=2729629 RepID=A0A7Y0L651_9FIRM|nr:lytic transglycosylase domain-containing protein [Sulfobacillus harzensis]
MVKNPKTGKLTKKVIPHDLSYTDLSGPIQVWGTEKSGHNVPFTSSAVSGSAVPVWAGGTVWGARVPLTGPDALKSITARWPDGAIDTIPWPEAAGGGGGTVWHLLSNPQALKKWWPDIGIAAQKAGAGMPSLTQFEDASGAVMLHESGGIPNLYANGDTSGAYGLMQIEPATAQGLPGYYPGARHNPQENLILGAELLAELYHQTGSWHMAFAEYYYGSLPPGYQPGMTWSQVSALYDFVPAGGNSETVAAYADQMVAEMHVVAQEAPKS